MADEFVEGWAYPTSTARRVHYFSGDDRRALCGKYALIIVPPGGTTPDTGQTSPDDCAACARKMKARRG